MDKVILFGIGTYGKRITELISRTDITISCYLDNSKKDDRQLFYEKKVYLPKCVTQFVEEDIIIASVDQNNDMYNMLLEYGVKRERIKHYKQAIIEIYGYIFNKTSYLKMKSNKSPVIYFGCMNGMVLGGIEEWSKNVTLELFKNSYNAWIIAKDIGTMLSSDIKHRIELINISKDRYCYDNISKLVNVLLCSEKCVVVTSFPDELMIAAIIVKLYCNKELKIISVIHGGMELNYREYTRLRDYIDVFLGVSEDICREMIKKGLDASKMMHMTCPVNCNLILEREYSLENKPIRIGYAGRIEIEQKRIDLLMELIRKLEKSNIDYVFDIAGDGSCFEKIKKFIQEENLNQKVRMMGNISREQIPDFWRRQDIAINISDYEGRSISNMEAMANGAIPIVTNTSGMQENIEDGENGYIVDIGNYTKMTSRITYLYENRSMLQSMGMKAHREIFEKCQMKDHLIFWKELLERII